MTEPIPKGEEIEGSYRKYTDSRFACSLDLIDLPNRQCIVEIERVEHHPKLVYENKKSVKQAFVMYFKKAKKPLVACNTAMSQIATILKTSDVKEWKGRKVIMFAEEGKYWNKPGFAVRFRGEEVKS